MTPSDPSEDTGECLAMRAAGCGPDHVLHVAADIRDGGWTVQHGENPECVLLLADDDPAFVSEAALARRLTAWLTRVHAYEATGEVV